MMIKLKIKTGDTVQVIAGERQAGKGARQQQVVRAVLAIFRLSGQCALPMMSFCVAVAMRQRLV